MEYNVSLLIAFAILTKLFQGIVSLVPDEASRTRLRRDAGVEASLPLDNEAMFIDMHEGLVHPFYSQIAKRPGRPTRTHSCNYIRDVPNELRRRKNMRPDGLHAFYQKYTEAYGIPIVSSAAVADDALKRACYVVRFLLADSRPIRTAVYKMSGRFAVIGRKENVTSIPEHSYLEEWWNRRARGLGATWDKPISTTSEENILCQHDEDVYEGDDIALHEFLHALHNIGANYAIPDFEEDMESRYESAKKSGIWKDTYSMSTDREYFSEAGQSYLNSHAEAVPGNGIHNQVNTREELRIFDPNIYQLFATQIFTCNNKYLAPCRGRKTSKQMRKEEMKQILMMDCDDGSRGTPDALHSPEKKTKGIKEKLLVEAVEVDQVPNEVEVIHVVEADEVPHEAEVVQVVEADEVPHEAEVVQVEAMEVDKVSIEQQETCTDDHAHCEYWATNGECQTSADYMSQNCRYSCGLC